MTGNHGGAQVWLGQCQVAYRHQAGQPDAQRYRVQVATWCNNPESFARSVEIHMADIGLALLHTGEPLPKGQWLAQHQGEATPGADAEAQQLANKVEQYGNTALGYLYAIKAGTATTTQSYLHIETLDGIEPLDGQFDVHPPKTVPDKLYKPLFGQPEPTEQETEQYGSKVQVPPMKLYAILDAAKVKVPGLRNLLDTSGLDFACLITGQDYEELKDSAPYIVELKEDNDFTRTLFTYNPNFSDKHLTVHLWHKEPGIYIRSRASLVELGQHFVQFVRIQDEQGKRYFFRFWEPSIAPHYFDSIKHIPEKCAQWMVMHNAGRVDQIIANLTGNKSVWVFSPDWNKLEGFANVGTSMLSDVEIAGFVKYRRERFVEELLPYFKEKDAFHAEAIGDDGLEKVIRLGIKKAAIYGLTRTSPVKLYIHTMLYLGSYFDEDPMLPWAQTILTSEKFADVQTDKANALRAGLIDDVATVGGKQGEYLQSFMRACQAELDHAEAAVSDKAIVSFIRSHYPQKYSRIGGSSLAQLIQDSKHVCQTHGLNEGRSVLILVCLRFVYGTKMADDPLFPWMKKVLEADTEKASKDELFHKVTRKFLGEIVQHLTGEH